MNPRERTRLPTTHPTPVTSDRSDPADALKPLLQEAEAEVARRLQAASQAEARDISAESSEELRRLEDELLGAVRAVEQTVAIRRVLEQGARTEQGQAPTDGVQQTADEPPCLVREFTDRSGRPWRGWQVIPGRARPRKDAGRFLGPFAGGWLAFEALDGSSRKRLLAPTEGWATRSEEELVELLEKAVEVTPRSA